MSDFPVPAPEQIPEQMKAVICHGPENYTLEEVAVPRPGPGEALVRVEAVGICASDLKCYHGAPKCRRRRPGDIGADRTVLELPLLSPRPVLAVRAA